MSSLDLALVTDEQQLAALANEALLRDGHALSVVTTERLRDGWDFSPHDAVIVDLALAEGPLADISRAATHTIVIGSTGTGDEILSCLRAGAGDYVAPPVTCDALREAVERIAAAHSDQAARIEIGSGHDREVVALRDRLTLTIGRDPTNDVQLDQKVVSRFHAVLDRSPRGWSIEDRESRHGVLVNGERLVHSRALRDGDVVRLGKPTAPSFVFRDRTLPEGPEPTNGSHLESPRPAERQESSDSEREFHELAALLDTFLQLNSDLVLEDVLALVISRSIEFAGADQGMILLLDELRPVAAGPRASVPGIEGHDLHVVMARDREGNDVDVSRLSISRKVPQEVLETGKGVIVEDFLSEGKAIDHSSTIEIGVRSAMCVPLRARSPGGDTGSAATLLGVLYVDSRSRPGSFSAQLLHALESLAREAAAAILNARLYQVSLEKQRLDQEMRLAREIQENLLPPESFRNDWMQLHGSSRPSRAVGGDVLEYFPRGPSRIGLLVGDVSGKGIPAAIFSALLDGHFHALSSLPGAEHDLGALAEELNAYLVAKSRLQKFVTLFFGVLEETGTLTYVNAGHNPPFVLHAADGSLERLGAGGTIMGMFDDADYESATVRLERNDVLVIFSDGITEARNPAREFFGEERLAQVVSECARLDAASIHAAIQSQLTAFTRGAPASDDVTLMVVKRLR